MARMANLVPAISCACFFATPPMRGKSLPASATISKTHSAQVDRKTFPSLTMILGESLVDVRAMVSCILLHH